MTPYTRQEIKNNKYVLFATSKKNGSPAIVTHTQTCMHVLTQATGGGNQVVLKIHASMAENGSRDIFSLIPPFQHFYGIA